MRRTGGFVNVAVLCCEDLRDSPIREWARELNLTLFIYADAQAGPQDSMVGEAPDRRPRWFENFARNGNVEAAVLEDHDRFGFERTVAIGECDVLRAARLRAALKLPGQTVESALAFRDKAEMKKRWAERGVPTAPYAVPDSALALIEFRRRHGLPLFAKPRASTEGLGATPIADEAAWTDFLERGFSAPTAFSECEPNFLIETMVQGRLFHVDGCVAEGSLRAIVASRYAPVKAPDGRRIARGSVTLVRESQDSVALIAATESALAALPAPRDFVFHAELFLTNDGRPLVNEIACRAGAGKIASTVRITTGIDLARFGFFSQIQTGQEALARSSGLRIAPSAAFALLLPGQNLRAPSAKSLSRAIDYSGEGAGGAIAAAAAFGGDTPDHAFRDALTFATDCVVIS